MNMRAAGWLVSLSTTYDLKKHLRITHGLPFARNSAELLLRVHRIVYVERSSRMDRNICDRSKYSFSIEKNQFRIQIEAPLSPSLPPHSRYHGISVEEDFVAFRLN